MIPDGSGLRQLTSLLPATMDSRRGPLMERRSRLYRHEKGPRRSHDEPGRIESGALDRRGHRTDSRPAWSPDSNRVVFTSVRDGNQDIYRMLSQPGSPEIRLTNNPALDEAASWSPDGSRIAFRSNRDGNLEVYSMNVDGSDQRNLSRHPSSDFDPTWGLPLFGLKTPKVVWPDPADIVFGTPLGPAQLNAAADVPGTFVYTPPAGTVLRAGDGQQLSLTFTPSDRAAYRMVSADVRINVLKATPRCRWDNPAPIVYPTPLGTTQLNATCEVPGAFAYTPPLGTILGAGLGRALSAAFTPTDLANYTSVTVTVRIDVLKATPVITWANPAPIIAGTPLGPQQLNAAANVPGTFAYTPRAGTILGAGRGQTLSVAFTPTDAMNYTGADATTTIDVISARRRTNGKIVFQSSRDGDGEIYVMNADGSNEINISRHHAADEGDPAICSDGVRVAFISNRDANNEIYVMNIDGTGRRRVTHSAAEESQPVWSPDCTQIAFTRGFGPRASDIYIVTLETSAERAITSNVPGYFPAYSAPEWSPDGGSIALMASLSDTNTEIYVTKLDGSGLTQITRNGVNSRFPRWCLFGTRLMFDRGPAGSADVYVMNPDGSDQVNLTKNSRQINEVPVCSPDGHQIAFTSWRTGMPRSWR